MKMAAFHIVVAGMNHRPIGADFGAAKRASEPLKPVDGSAAGRITRDYADMTMSQTQQVASSAFGCSCIVDPDSSDKGVTHLWVTVRVHNRKSPQNQSSFCPRGI